MLMQFIKISNFILCLFFLTTYIHSNAYAADKTRLSERGQTIQTLKNIIDGKLAANLPSDAKEKLIKEAKCNLALLEEKKDEEIKLLCPDEKNVERRKRRTRDAASGRRSKRIVNGIISKAFPAAGALLRGADPKSAKIHCSGTLIGPRTFLTAAHCVADLPNEELHKVFFLNAGFFEVKHIDWPKNEYTKGSLKGDIAVLRLKTTVPDIQPIKINTLTNMVANIPGEIVGFGRTGGLNFDYGIKRVGSVKTTHCSGKRKSYPLLCWKYNSILGLPGRYSNTCHADSGGGFYVRENGEYYVVGVTSGGLRKDCLSGDESYDTNVFHYAKWIMKASKGDVSIKQNSYPAFINIEDVSSYKTLELTDKSIQQAHNLTLTEKTKSLRVAMNGEDNGKGKNNFDLYLIPDGSKNIKKAKCIQNGEGLFGYCQIDNPKPGPWTALVRHDKGSGNVQLTITELKK